MRLVTYSLLRVALLLGVVALLYLLGLRSWLLLLAAPVVAALLTYVLFPRQRDAAAAQLAARSARQRGRPRRPTGAEEDAAYEDALVDGTTRAPVRPEERAPAPADDEVRAPGGQAPARADEEDPDEGTGAQRDR